MYGADHPMFENKSSSPSEGFVIDTAAVDHHIAGELIVGQRRSGSRCQPQRFCSNGERGKSGPRLP